MFWSVPDETKGSIAAPGIYRFTIEGEGIYVGRYTRSSRVLKEYVRNVEKQKSRRPYRPQDPNGFRFVHVALFRAVEDGRNIHLEIVENVPVERLNERERYWIEQIPIEQRLNGRRRPR